MNSKGHPTTEISAVQRRFLHLFAMNDTAGVSGCYTQDAQMLVANMDVIRGRNSPLSRDTRWNFRRKS